MTDAIANAPKATRINKTATATTRAGPAAPSPAVAGIDVVVPPMDDGGIEVHAGSYQRRPQRTASDFGESPAALVLAETERQWGERLPASPLRVSPG